MKSKFQSKSNSYGMQGREDGEERALQGSEILKQMRSCRNERE